MVRDSIFLSGWEYNRVLAPTPLTPMVSGLPAPALWEGGAHFWLFRNVYCTTEAFNGDYAAYEDMGWSTGRIFSDLKRRKFLKTIDLNGLSSENPDLGEKLVARHAQLRSEYDEAKICALLKAGQEIELERIKLYLLMPVLEQLQCVQNVSPNSIRSWVNPPATTDTPGTISGAVGLLAEPLVESADQFRSGTVLCRRPGSGLPEHIRLAQDDVEREVQKPLIPDLLTGRLSQSDYHKALQSTRKVYEEIDKQLWADYCDHITRLEDLHNLAEVHIWKDLHNEWLPKLEGDSTFLPQFMKLLRDAVLQARFDPFLEIVTTIGIGIAGLAVASSAGALAGPSVGALAGLTTSGSIHVAHKRRREETKPYAMFYQRALRKKA